MADKNEHPASRGESDDGTINELVPRVYQEMLTIAKHHLQRYGNGDTLSPSDLVHEAYLKLANHDALVLKGRTHFFALSAKVMRQLLVSYARKQNAQKRGGDKQRISMSDDLLAEKNPETVLFVHDALDRLEQRNARQAAIIEMRFFSGMSMQEIADHLAIGKRTVEAEWAEARKWLWDEWFNNCPE